MKTAFGSCGCDVAGAGTLRDPVRIVYCAAHGAVQVCTIVPIHTDLHEMALTLGYRVRALREGARLSPRDLASRALVSLDAVQRLERGTSLPNLRTLVRVTDALGLDVGRIFYTSRS